MKHPFEAILPMQGDDDLDTPASIPTRRQVMGRAVSAGAVVVGLGSVVSGASTEEDAASGGSSSKPSKTKPAAPKPENPTSTRKGEEGGVVTTQAIGEEGGFNPGSTTKRVGEEGGFHGPGQLHGGGTTKAVGEEGGLRPLKPIKPRKFAELKKFYDTAMKKGDVFAASSILMSMKSHPEAEAHKAFLDKAEAVVTKAGWAVLADAKAAAKKGDINTAFDKTRSLEFYFAIVDVVLQANKFHVELRTNEKYKKGYKQAVREFTAKNQFTRAQSFKSVEQKRFVYQDLVRFYSDTVYGKKAGVELAKLAKPKVNPNPGRATTLAVGEEG